MMVSFFSTILFLVACAACFRIAYVLRGGLLAAAWLFVALAAAAGFVGPVIPELVPWTDAIMAVSLVISSILMTIAVAKLHPKK